MQSNNSDENNPIDIESDSSQNVKKKTTFCPKCK